MIEARQIARHHDHAEPLKGISLSMPSGSMVGMLGTSGSGISTLFKVLATLVRPTSGSARMAGYDIEREAEAARRATGFLPDFPGVYNDLSPREMLDLYARAGGLAESRREDRLAELIRMGDLTEKADDYIGNLKPVEKRRLALLRAIVHDPAVLLLDDPAGGLAIEDRIEIRELVGRLHRSGKTVLVGSNLLTDLIGLCPELVVMDRGEAVCQGPAETVQAALAGARRLELEVANRTGQAAEWLRAQPSVRFADAYAEYILCGIDAMLDHPGRLVEQMSAQGFIVVRYREHEVDLDGVLEKLREIGLRDTAEQPATPR